MAIHKWKYVYIMCMKYYACIDIHILSLRLKDLIPRIDQHCPVKWLHKLKLLGEQFGDKSKFINATNEAFLLKLSSMDNMVRPPSVLKIQKLAGGGGACP